MSAASPVVVRVTRRFAASAERVFDAFLDPEKARRFLFATPTGQMVTVEIDRPRRLVFSFAVEKGAKGDRVSIDIVPLETGCELTLTHEMSPEWAEWAEKTREGWTGIVQGLAALLDEGGAGEDNA